MNARGRHWSEPSPMSDDLVPFNEPLFVIAGHSKTDLTYPFDLPWVSRTVL